MVLEPSRRKNEALHDARFRVADSIRRDPLFWLSLGLVLVAFVRWLNGGVAMSYDAEKKLWSLAEPVLSFLPGGVSGSGLLPFASVVAVLVLMQACRHALGKSARVCFLFVAAFLAGIAAIVATVSGIFGNPESLRYIRCSTVDATYPGMAFGLCFTGSTVAMAGAFERKWNRAMPLLSVAIGGCAVGMYLFAPDAMILVCAASALVALAGSLLYVQYRVGGLVIPKCLAFLLVTSVLPLLFIIGVVPDAFKENRLACLSGADGFHFLSDGFLALRAALSEIALKVWKENPWLGTGLGSFSFDIRFLAEEKDWALFAPNQAGALNGWLQMLAERGISGIAFFVAPLPFLAWSYVLRAYHAVADALARSRHLLSALVFHPICLLGPLAVAATAACGFLDNSLTRPETMMVAAAMFAMAGSAFPAPKSASDENLTEK